MAQKINFKLLFSILIALLDEAIIFFIVIFVLSQFGIEIPLWLIITLAFLLAAITFLIYRTLKKEPLLGFESMVGKKGIAVEPITPRGTVRISNELWQAETSSGRIEKGAEVVVVEQTGLKLKVAKIT